MGTNALLLVNYNWHHKEFNVVYTVKEGCAVSLALLLKIGTSLLGWYQNLHKKKRTLFKDLLVLTFLLIGTVS